MISENQSELIRDLHHVWHPCTQHKDYETTPPILIERAEGIYLQDRQGNRYMDVIASWWVNLFGHNHPRLNKALTQQLEKMAHVMFAGITHQPAIDLADSLVALSPSGLEKVFFSDNGSTAVEVALKMSLQYWQEKGESQKVQFAYLKGGYHGETLGALSVCGLEIFRGKFEKVLPSHLPVEGPDCFRCPYGLQRESCNAECFEPMEKALGENSDTLAGVIVEPLVQGAAGMMMYPPIYLKKLQTVCESLGIHMIFDEIAVAFGRTGSLFVCGAHDLRPTFLCLSKGITSGYLPLSATLTTDEIYSAFYGEYDDMKLFIHSHSYSANPLACAVANETLKMLTENNFLESLKPKIATLKECGKQFEGLNGEFRQTGMIAAVELVKNNKERHPFEKRIGYQVFLEGLKRGLFMRPLGDVVYFIPPLVISEAEIETMLNTAHDCINAVLR
ncbi:MAG: adenosylmethionine--8-amino-7-oxononanoate transaminase [Nitrospina sp.]|jgi:adenosylmethionine---8-amino-7-oxononanoate aminotransferase|nr:adenosylmethionine--8-amino-7-oxononanoate transaminase [Nitrospina sp.]MBT3874854.1 adenosylmethionine--8-amino-7-oxononanoate transaminase [Nitrospina sp.]MBT4049753.1 adenosylmethionine--8-amino-7-oxononanoate transaminase [Nitrospina sp.]MBT4558765.1 adenosylmethionine--8-amino-7-oxononanoate transaminase [Nitrospina sp.]MBT5347296.1 adenosylmethionine--8-amino-7-oxononanoate transaminase [Nitrospina sp.]